MICFVATTALCQPTIQQRIEDSVIGWKTKYNFKDKQYKTIKVDGQSFSPYQQAIRDSFICWMQKTYQPIAGWGDIFNKDFTTRQNKGPVPQGIGIDAMVYGLMNKNGKYQMISNEDHNDMAIYTNKLFGINPVLLFNSSEGFFFTMPRQNYSSTFTDNEVIAATKAYGLHEGDRFSKYMVYFPSTWVTVVLTPGNQLPIVQLTKGEVLEQCEKGLLREMQTRVAEAKHMSSNNPSYYAREIKDWEEKHYPQALKNLSLLKEKYKDRLNEPAVLFAWSGPSFTDFLNASDSNPTTLFVEDWYQQKPGFPVYRYTKEAIEASKKDKPLWVAITWQAQKPNSLVKGYELHRAMQRYFNYDYVYDYFFNPEKVKGKSYTPDNAGEQKSRLQQLQKNNTGGVTKDLPAGVFFTEDFSANADGSRPTRWNDSRSRTPAEVTTIKDQQGKWVRLGHMNELTATLNKALPENFSLDFDVVTDAFDARTGGAVKLQLSSYPVNAEGRVVAGSKGSSISWLLEAGNEADYSNNNYRGRSMPVIGSTIPGFEGDYNLPVELRVFTNKKSRLHATMVVKNGQAQFFINGKLIAASGNFKKDYCNDCVCKGIPPSTFFRNLSFTNTTQSWRPDGKQDVNVYISNIKITKE